MEQFFRSSHNIRISTELDSNVCDKVSAHESPLLYCYYKMLLHLLYLLDLLDKYSVLGHKDHI